MGIQVRHDLDPALYGQAATQVGDGQRAEFERQQNLGEASARTQSQQRNRQLNLQEAQLRQQAEQAGLNRQHELERAKLDQEKWANYNESQIQMQRERAQIEVAEGRAEYTQAQKRKANELRNALQYIQTNPRYTNQERQLLADQVMQQFHGIQPLPVLPNESEFPKGRGIGDVWMHDVEGLGKIPVTRKADGTLDFPFTPRELFGQQSGPDEKSRLAAEIAQNMVGLEGSMTPEIAETATNIVMSMHRAFSGQGAIGGMAGGGDPQMQISPFDQANVMEVFEGYNKVMSMPNGPERMALIKELQEKSAALGEKYQYEPPPMQGPPEAPPGPMQGPPAPPPPGPPPLPTQAERRKNRPSSSRQATPPRAKKDLRELKKRSAIASLMPDSPEKQMALQELDMMIAEFSEKYPHVEVEL